MRMKARVIRPKDFVISVQRSGTRSLVAHLGHDRHTHFGQKSGRNIEAAEHWHVPIRHPMDVAAAWARRGECLDKLLRNYGLMFEFLENKPNHTLYRVEDLPRTRGTDEPGKADPSVTEAYQSKVMRLVVEPHREFFQRFYDL